MKQISFDLSPEAKEKNLPQDRDKMTEAKKKKAAPPTKAKESKRRMGTYEIVQELWKLCHVLRDGGVNYQQYVNELTYLLFLKMSHELEMDGGFPEGCRWADLNALGGAEQMKHYRQMLLDLGSNETHPQLKIVYVNASTALKQPVHLGKLVDAINDLDWYNAQEEGLGDLYEGLLEKNAGEVKSGAGQYFTPRVLIETIVELVKPQPGEFVQDPALGTGGFLIAADRYVKDQTDDMFDLSEEQQEFQKKQAFYGVELVEDTQRLAMMNMMLHNIEAGIHLGDALSPLGKGLKAADVILSNPPFGTKTGGGAPDRDDFTFPTSNKQLAFLQHIYRNLKPGGRAAVVLPDNVLFEDNTGRKIREDLMNKCNLHTILRLPTGIYYAQGVKTNVLFFTKGVGKDTGNTEDVWVYDLRTNMPSFGKRTPFTRAHMKEFVDAFGDDPLGQSERTDQGEEGRFRCFTRQQIADRNDNLDLSWLKDNSIEHADELPEPDEIAAEIVMLLRAATEEMEALVGLLGNSEAFR